MMDSTMSAAIPEFLIRQVWEIMLNWELVFLAQETKHDNLEMANNYLKVIVKTIYLNSK